MARTVTPENREERRVNKHVAQATVRGSSSAAAKLLDPGLISEVLLVTTDVTNVRHPLRDDYTLSDGDCT
eukprot:551083-Prorocentrum_minimum.AAC.2